MIRWNPLTVIPSFAGVENGSYEELDTIYRCFETMDLPILCERAEDGENLGYVTANDMLVRLTPHTGIMVNPMRKDTQVPYDFGYVYHDPQHAISWILGQLGFATNSISYESEVLLFHIPENDRPFRLSFEIALNDAQFDMYTQILSTGTPVERIQSSAFGSRLKNFGRN